MPSAAFDEILGADGHPRPAYEALRRRMRRDPLRPSPEVVERLRERPLGDDTRILPIPLALEESDYSTIRSGVAQRAVALQAFFRDVVLGEGQLLAGGGGGGGLVPPLLDEILATEQMSLASLRRMWETHAPDEIRFVYGPDLAREPGGGWVVLEDNVGCVGGSADSFFVADAYARAAGLPAPAPANADLVRAVERWRSQLKPTSSGRVVAVLGCEPGVGDPGSPQLLENARRARLLDSLGIDVFDDTELERLLRSAPTTPTAVVNFDHGGAPMAEAAFGRLRLPLLNAPGTGLLGNKALLPFVGDMIRQYCGDEPQLATPSTELLRDGELPTPAPEWVVKTSVGAGGTGVFVLSSLAAEQLDAVRERVRAAGPCGTVAQRWVEPSTLSPDGPGAWDVYRVEVRPMTYVLGWQEVVVGEQPLGKAVSSFDRRRLNNVSLGASYLPVLRETAAAAALGDGGVRS